MESCTVQSDLVGQNSFHHFIFLIWRYIIVCAVVFDITTAQIATLSLSETKVTLRDGDTLVLKCDANYTASTAMFQWEHRNYLSEKTTLTAESERVNIFDGPSSSLLQISNLFTNESGIITCVYSYPSENGRFRVSMDTILCISGEPVCTSAKLMKDAFNISCSTSGTYQCFDDINVELRGNGKIVEGNQTINVNNIERLATIPKNQITNGDYMCILRSEMYPNITRNCTFQFEEMFLSTTATASNTSVTIPPITPHANDTDSNSSSTTKPDTTTITTYSISIATDVPSSVTFTLTQLIIAGSAAAGGVLFLAVLMCLIIACCKRCKKSDNVADGGIEMHKRSTQPLSTVTETTSPTPNYFVIEQPLHQNESPRKGSMPAYAKPNKTGAKKDTQDDDMDTKRTPLSTSNDLTNDNDMLTDQYASINDIDMIEEDRDKVSTPTNLSPHDYAYASFDLTKAAILGSTKPSTHSDVNVESKTGIIEEEGFVENSIYDPMV